MSTPTLASGSVLVGDLGEPLRALAMVLAIAVGDAGSDVPADSLHLARFLHRRYPAFVPVVCGEISF